MKKLHCSIGLSLLLCANTLLAEASPNSIDALLSDYRVASDLSNQTKKEAGGSVIIYSRDDLERMQAYNLRDVLKTIPLFTLQETMTGPVTMAQATGASFNSQYIKFYINDHELGSVVFGSAMKMWGFMDISHIDHIEVYQTGSSVSAGDEPPGMVIKLYTKDAARDSGTQIQTIQSSRSSDEYNVYHAGTTDGLSYFVYLDHHDEDRKTIQSGQSAIERDFETTNFFGSLSNEHFKIDIAQFKLYQDGMFGLGMGKQPTGSYADLKHQYVTYTQYFLDRSLKFKASYDNAVHIRHDQDSTGIRIYEPDGTIGMYNSWHYDKDENVMNFSLSKKMELSDHDMEIGIQYMRKAYEPQSLLIDGTERVGDISDYRKLDIYSIFLTDDYAIDANNLCVMSLKYDYHVHNSQIADSDNYVVRLGYIYNDETWLSKTFLVHTYGYPVFMQNSYFPFVYNQNTDLKDEQRYAVSTELHYKTAQTKTSLRLLYNTVKHAIKLDGTPQTNYVNNDERPEFHAIYAEHEFRFDQHNKLLLSVYTSDNNQPEIKSSDSGAAIRLFNRFGDFDLYNELLYRSAYSFDVPASTLRVNVDDGYDYTAAISYHATKDLTFSLKAENLLDKAIETPYPVPARNIVEYLSPIDRTVRFGMKYVF